MAVTTIDLDQKLLETAKALAGAKSNREAVTTALRTFVAVRRQPAAVERIIGRSFTDEQIAAAEAASAGRHPADPA